MRLAKLAAVLTTLLSAVACVAGHSGSVASSPGGKARPAEEQAHGSADKMCGGIAAIGCGHGEYCQIREGQCRMVADVAGVCRPKPQVCTMIYAPVCGCDGRTYPSACQAAAAGASVAAQGACKS